MAAALTTGSESALAARAVEAITTASASIGLTAEAAQDASRKLDAAFKATRRAMKRHGRNLYKLPAGPTVRVTTNLGPSVARRRPSLAALAAPKIHGNTDAHPPRIASSTPDPRVTNRIGRNAPCPCGSAQRKLCCGAR